MLNKIAPAGGDARWRAENKFGSGPRAYRLAQAGQASAILAVTSNAAMLVTTLARTKTDHAELLPLGWLVANALLTSGSNLAGFILFTSLGARNGQLLVEVHKGELKIAKVEVGKLKKQLEDVGLTPAPALGTDLFRRRSSTAAASADAVQQVIDTSTVTEAEVGAAAVSAVLTAGLS